MTGPSIASPDAGGSMAVLLLRGFFVLLMALTGVAKLLDMPGFIAVVASYQSLPGLLIAPAAWALTLAELAMAAWLLWGAQLRNAAAALLALHLLYLLWLLMALLRGLELPNCGCFGVYWPRPLTWASPLEDLLLLGLAALLYRRAPRSRA